MKGVRNRMSNMYIQDFIWCTPHSMVKALFILKVQNWSHICTYANWKTACANSSVIYKGKLWMQVKCGF